MPKILHLPTAAAQLAEVLDLVRWAIAQGFCTHDSLAASMGVSRSFISMMLEGRRPGRFGLMRALYLHLDLEQYTAVLVEQARRHGVDPGDILRERARQEVTRAAWAEVAEVAMGRSVAAVESILPPLRRARRKVPSVPVRQLALLKEAA